MIYALFICAKCMPAGIPGTHGICPRCWEPFEAQIQAIETGLTLIPITDKVRK